MWMFSNVGWLSFLQIKNPVGRDTRRDFLCLKHYRRCGYDCVLLLEFVLNTDGYIV